MAATYVTDVKCSDCGKRVSGVDPELGLVVRAYVSCPECLARILGAQEWKVELVAAAIAHELFTNGLGDHADHLVLHRGGVNLGGWSEDAVIQRIALALTKADP